MASSCCRPTKLLNMKTKVVTARRLAREYNAGLPALVEEAQSHNERIVQEFKEVGIVRSRDIKASLMPLPQPCPEDINMRFVRKFWGAFNWRKAARNTPGQYLAPWQQKNQSPVLSHPYWIVFVYIYIHMIYIYIYMCIFYCAFSTCTLDQSVECYLTGLMCDALRSGMTYAYKLQGKKFRTPSRMVWIADLC